MLFKLAFKNAKRSIKDYLIYLITLTVAVSLIFAFNSIVFSEDLMELSSVLTNFRYVIVFFSLIVTVIIGWLINYTIHFLFQRRSKEFGTYTLLGIDNKRLARLFLLENMMIQVIAFILGIIFGVYLFQIISVMIMTIFDNPYQVTIQVSLKAIALTALYLLIMCVYSLVRHRRKFYKLSIKNLIYTEKQNEKSVIKNRKINVVIFCLSTLLMVLGILILRDELVNKQDLNGIFLPSILIIIGIYGFYLSFSKSLLLLLKNKRFANTHTNTFLIRTLTSKINKIGLTFGTLAVLFTLTIVTLNISSTFNGIFTNLSDTKAPTDIVIYNYDEDETFDDYRNYIVNQFTVENEYEYNTYYTHNSEIKNLLFDTKFNNYNEKDFLIKQSDYNQLLNVLGEQPVHLASDEFIINCSYNGLDRTIINSKHDLTFKVGGHDLNYGGTAQVKIPLRSNYAIVLPDDLINDHQFSHKTYVVNTLEETTEDDYDTITQFIKPIKGRNGADYIPLGNVIVKGKVEAENKGLFTIISFSCYYLAIILICTALTILSIQQLSDSSKYPFRYKILDHMGLEKERINYLVFKQLMSFFLIPTIIPIILSFFIVGFINQMLELYLKNDYIGYIYYGQMLGVFFIIYMIYFVTTYVMFVRNIRSE